MALFVSLRPEQLAGGDGRVMRFADIATRHADDHRSKLEEALGLPS